jgi:hypothetical protein
MNYLLGLSDMVWAKDRPFVRLDLVQRCTTSAAIQCFEGCHSEALLITVIVRELNQWQPLIPFVMIVQHTSFEHIFKDLIYSQHLTIGLRMIS